MTQALFRDDAYRSEAEATVMSSEPRGVALDCTVFYAQGGGQSGDRGTLMLEDGLAVPIVNTVYDSDRATILHVPPDGAALPRPGARVIARIDWKVRYQRMRAHTALHLLSVVLPYPVTGGRSAMRRDVSISIRARPSSIRRTSSAGSTNSSRLTRR
jgi:misacylated tRNA(Ala) deacylase